MKMNRSQKSQFIKLLKRTGFKRVKGYSFLYIDENGKVYNLKRGRCMKITARNTIIIEKEHLSVPKLVLEAFKGIPVRKGQITFIDGNNLNRNVENIKYSRIFAPDEKIHVNKADLVKVIRCYYQVEKRYKLKDSLKTQSYLTSITRIRNFFETYAKVQHIEVFHTYLSGTYGNLREAAKIHNIAFADCQCIINSFFNLLICDVLKDIEKGTLRVLEYQAPIRTTTQIIRDYNKELIERGKKPLPLRKKSDKELLREFEKTRSHKHDKN